MSFKPYLIAISFLLPMDSALSADNNLDLLQFKTYVFENAASFTEALCYSYQTSREMRGWEMKDQVARLKSDKRLHYGNLIWAQVQDQGFATMTDSLGGIKSAAADMENRSMFDLTRYFGSVFVETLRNAPNYHSKLAECGLSEVEANEFDLALISSDRLATATAHAMWTIPSVFVLGKAIQLGMAIRASAMRAVLQVLTVSGLVFTDDNFSHAYKIDQESQAFLHNLTSNPNQSFFRALLPPDQFWKSMSERMVITMQAFQAWQNTVTGPDGSEKVSAESQELYTAFVEGLDLNLRHLPVLKEKLAEKEVEMRQVAYSSDAERVFVTLLKINISFLETRTEELARVRQANLEEFPY